MEHNKKGEKRTVDVTIGPSKHRTKRVTYPGISKVEHVPINPQQADWVDKFSVHVQKGEYFIVTRVDHDAGWGQHLVLRCKVRGDAQPYVHPDEEKKATLWEPIEGAAKHVAIDAQGNCIACSPEGHILEKPHNAREWSKIDGQAMCVARGADGDTWCTTPQSVICHRQGNAWKTMPGAAVFVTVGSATEVVVMNAGGLIYKWDPAKNNWHALEGAAVTGSIAPDGTFYVINKNEEVFRKLPTGTGFTRVSGKGTSIAVLDKKRVYLTDSSGKVFLSTDEGATWTPVEGSLRNIAGAQGHLVGTNSSNQLFHQLLASGPK